MEAEKLRQFLNKGKVKILTDAGNGRVFIYFGELTEVNDDSSFIIDRKGQTLISNKLILQISDLENGG